MSLITQAIQETPEVIIVTDQPSLALIKQITELLIENNLHPTLVSPAQFSPLVLKFQTTEKYVHKVIVLTGFNQTLSEIVKNYNFQTSSNQETLSQDWQEFFSQLVDSQLTATFILNQSEYWPLKTKNHFVRGNLLKLSQAKLVLARALELTSAQIFVAKDCLTQTFSEVESGGEMELPLTLATMCAQERILLDPQKLWHIQTQEGLFEAIAQQLLKPHRPGKILIQGKPILSQSILLQIRDLIEKYFAYSPTLLPLSPDSEIIDFEPEIVCQVDSEIIKHLDAQIRTLPHSLIKLDEFARLAQSMGQTVSFSPHSVLSDLSTHYSGYSKASISSTPLAAKTIEREIESQPTIKRAVRSSGLDVKPVDKSLTQQLEVSPIQIDKEKAENNAINQSKVREESNIKPINVADLEGELQRIFNQKRGEQLYGRLSEKAKITKKIIGKKKRHQAIFYLGFSMAAVGLIILVLWGVFQASYLLASQSWERELLAYSKLSAQSTEIETQTSRPAKFWLKPLEWQISLYRPILDEELLADANTIVELSEELQEFINQEIALKQSIGALIKGVIDQPILDFNQQLSVVDSQLIEHQKTTTSLVTKLEKLDLSQLEPSAKEQLQDLKSQATQVENTISSAQKITASLPEIFGAEGKRTYGIIVQNQQELRPTGGFIQAVGLIKFDKNSLIDSNFYGVYDVDNKLASKIKPPDEIARFLGESNWYLRDSNWSPDFPSTARQVNFFLTESLNQPVDGVVAITLEVIKQWLSVTGPVDIPELNEQVTEKNLYDRLEFHAETKSVEINGQKLDYLSLLTTKLFAKFSQLSPSQLAKLTAVSYQMLQNHDIQITQFGESGRLWDGLGWSGSIIEPNCPSQFANDDCFIDSLYQVDANVGINKVNPFVTKKVVDHVDLSKTNISHQRIVTYKNLAKLDSWPQGQYRVYAKFYLSKTAAQPELFLNGHKIPPDQVVSYVEQGRVVIGALVQVPRQQSQTLELKYSQPITTKGGFSYFFFNQKQAGVEENQEVFLSYQPGLKVRQIAPQAELSNQLLNFNFAGKSHSFVGVSLE